MMVRGQRSEGRGLPEVLFLFGGLVRRERPPLPSLIITSATYCPKGLGGVANPVDIFAIHMRPA